MATRSAAQVTVSFGPELPGIGSWEWVGADLAETLAGDFKVVQFRDEIPACDVAVVVKDRPPGPQQILEAAQHSAVIFCPIDLYGSSAEIDRDWRMLRACARVVIHAERLRKYFQSYAPVEYVDHHVKYVSDMPAAPRENGPILWVGMRTHLPVLAEYVNRSPLPCELVVLTNLGGDADRAPAESFAFRQPQRIMIERWTPERHREWAGRARAAIDIKGQDFRQRHKPATKAVDYLAACLPLAMNADSASVEYLARLGFHVACPEDHARWLSRAYWEETQSIGRCLRQSLTLANISAAFRRIILSVLEERKSHAA